MAEAEERSYFQRRLREEIARSTRFRDPFSLVMIEATPAPGYAPSRRATVVAARLLERHLRACDVVAAVYEDTIAVMLIGTDAANRRDAEHRIHAALAGIGGSWRLMAYSYPEHGDAMQSLEFFTAA